MKTTPETSRARHQAISALLAAACWITASQPAPAAGPNPSAVVEEPAPPSKEPVPLAGSSCILEVGEKRVEMKSGDGLYDKIFIQQKESVRLTFKLENLKTGSQILVSAPNGGNLKVEGHEKELAFQAEATSETLLLDFDPGEAEGNFTVRVQNGGESQTVPLWVGRPMPLGEPGPVPEKTPENPDETTNEKP